MPRDFDRYESASNHDHTPPRLAALVNSSHEVTLSHNQKQGVKRGDTVSLATLNVVNYSVANNVDHGRGGAKLSPRGGCLQVLRCISECLQVFRVQCL